MKIVFRNRELENLANWIWDYKYPAWIWKKYRYVLHEISKMESVKEIMMQIWWFAERKKWDRIDQIWIRLNKWWRLMLKIEWKEITVVLIREITNHYE